jgi:hypothetical protein
LVGVLGFIAALAGIGIAAAATAWRSPIVPFLEAGCAFPVGAVVILEIGRAAIALWGSRGTAAQRRTIRRFQRHLDAPPETCHPVDG